MKVPKEISFLRDLSTWVKTNKPKMIIIGKSCELRKIFQMNPGGWKTFQGIKVKYL